MINDDKLKQKQSKHIKTSFKELSIIRNNIFWLDFVSMGQKINNAIFTRPFNEKNVIPQKLTGDGFHIKSNFHGYGGKSYMCLEFKNQLYVIWIDKYSNAIWFQIYEFLEKKSELENSYLLSVQDAKKLTKSIDANFDSSFVVSKENFLYGICEIKNKDFLFSLDLNKSEQDIQLLRKFDNFASDLSSNFSTNLLSWIEWDTPHMPWENNDLFFAKVDPYGEIKNISKFSKASFNRSRNSSFFQPYWISDDLIVCSEDSTGWWNLLFIQVCSIEKIIVKKRIKKKLYEYGTPQWITGIKYFSGSQKNLFCLAKKANSWILELYQDLAFVKKFDLPFSSVKDFNVFEKKLVLKGCGNDFFETLFEMDLENSFSFHDFKDKFVDNITIYSKPESFWFSGFDNQPTHSFIYKPIFKKFCKPPLLIRAHSGPTSYFDGSYNSEIQHWTGKGFFVAEVNYGGSSGFGRKYRERLNYKWGIVDSYDCKALVNELLKLDLVDNNKIVIFGNSAGGLTALNSLFDSQFFKAAICKYPVIDLNDMYINTHRFEKDYLNSLVGNYEKVQKDYEIRSPIYKMSTETKPILLFHGKKDAVISYKQTLKIKEQIIQNNKLSEVILFENEGHGFKNIETKKIVMKKTEQFLNKVLFS